MSHTFSFACPTVDATQTLAHVIGETVRGGELIEFTSDLGGGKTTFVKGLAMGMGVTDVVQSPTFTISQIHQAKRDLELHHFDFYRLDDPGIMAAELSESLAQPNAVVAIEWSDIVHNILPKDHLKINLSTPEGETRVIGIDVPPGYDHIRDALGDYRNKRNLA